MTTSAPAPTSEASPDPLGSPPPGRPRLIVGAFIALWLAWQVVVPLSYYLWGNVWEERFAWRMFSDVSVSALRCTVSVTELLEGSGAAGSARAPREVPLGPTLHGSWALHLRQGRQLVAERFLESRCRRDPSVSEARYHRACPAQRASRAPDLDARLDCRTGAFEGVSRSAR